jgi:hypothetical protein
MKGSIHRVKQGTAIILCGLIAVSVQAGLAQFSRQNVAFKTAAKVTHAK